MGNTNFKPITRPVFIGSDVTQMTNLMVFLSDHKFSVSLKKIGNATVGDPKKPNYAIIAPVEQHNYVFDKGVAYCIEKNYDNIVCGYPNLDFDLVKNIKEREKGLTR